MTYFVVENFGHGLDARRHILNLPPGTLYQAKNCNINRGGEPEACKAFVHFGGISPGLSFGLLSAGGKLYTFGSEAVVDMPAGINYQRLVHPYGGGAMTGYVYGTPVKGKPFVIARFAAGYGVFFNGLFIQDWKPPSGALTAMKFDGTIGLYTVIADVAHNLAGQIQAGNIYTATNAGNVITITGRPGIPFSISAAAVNGGGANDQTALVATTQVADPGSGAAPAKGTITFNGVTPEWNDQVNQGAGGYVPRQFISSVTVNGIQQLAQSLVAYDDAQAADGTANYCNLFTAAVDYIFTSANGIVTVTAKINGPAPNGFAIATDSSFASTTPLAGGSNGTELKAQISTVTLGGTYEAADAWTITLGSETFTVAANSPPSGGDSGDGSGGGSGGTPGAANGQIPTAAVAKSGKTFAIAKANLFGSKVGDCTVWNGPGSDGCFILDMSSEVAGAENLTALGIFQGNLAVFSRSTVQVRFVDPDPENDETLQVMQNIGTMASKSVVPFGDSDLFFLSDTGLRSLKTRSSTNSATVSDIGSPIDNLIIAAIKASPTNAAIACAAMEPVDGRFMLQIGTTTYVYSFFPDAKVSGWTTYESGLAITDFAVVDTRLFARAGDVVYLLGGNYYDAYSAQPMDIKLPFLSARQLSTLKHFTAVDVVCDGTFDVFISTDPTAPATEEAIATVNGSTLGLGSGPFNGEDVTAIALRFVGRANKYARLSAIVVHHESIKENAP